MLYSSKMEGSSRVGSSLQSGSFTRFGGHSRVSQIMLSRSNLGSTSRKNLASDSTRQFKSEVVSMYVQSFLGMLFSSNKLESVIN